MSTADRTVSARPATSHPRSAAGQPGSILPGTSQGVPFVVDVQNGSASSTVEDILATATGPQTATATLGAASTSYTVVAAFKP